MVWAGKLRKLWDSLSELRSSVCERRPERNSSESCTIAYQNCAVYLVFSVRSWSKIAQFDCECLGRLRDLHLMILKFASSVQIGARKTVVALWASL